MFPHLLVFCLFDRILADVAGYGSPHKGLNPTLYSTEDYVIQLDESSFNDTVYCNGTDCPAYLIEFYADWCGHCRGFAPIYKQLATDVKGWQNIVRIAAMNCADSLNEATCRANGVNYFPLIRYFPRNSSDAFSGSKLRPYNTVAEMRDQLTKVLMDDYAVNRFHDWPHFDYLGDVLTYGDLWFDVAVGVNHMAVIFENHQSSLTGAQLLMDLYDRRDSLAVRRCLKNHALATALHISDFPSLAIFKRGEKNPVLISELRRLMFTEIDNFLGSDGSNAELQRAQFSSRKNKTDICEKEPEKCKEMFYVSEVDMLKAMKYALYRETARTGAPLHGANLTALHSFTGLLADHFPVTSHNGENETYLDRSNRAVRVFARLRDFLEEKGLEATVPIEEWQKEFQSAEEAAGFPFPLSADWDHCKGSTGSYRGYTCGLWTAFHTLSVAAYRQAEATQAENFQPLTPLHAIRDWVGSFFGCIHCRDHFLRMTTNTFKMETQVSKPEDVFMYLWRAHNIVNARLKGRDSEDPKFPKYQVPAKFLCHNCTTETTPDDNEVKEFLIDYYSSIKPYVEENFTSKFFF